MQNKPLRNLIKGIIGGIITLLILTFIIRNSSVFYRKIIILPFQLHLNKQDLVLKKGEEYHLFVYGINKWVSYHSTNFRVAGVNFNGRVFAYQTGKAFIVAKVDGKELKCRVRVIDINKDKITLSVGDSARLKVTGPAHFPRWRSSDPNVATVSMFGRVKGKSKGSTVITARWKGKEVKCKVRVK
ncbi:MAG: hypothetical protein GX306_03690 [Clostridiales bacterium]|nr:hypothetical protein [Clostridiales bacterium]